MKRLVGKVIKEIFISKDGRQIAFKCLEEEGLPQRHHYRGWGDCCGDTQIDSVSGVKDILNQQVIEVNDTQLPTTDGSMTPIYSYQLTSLKGILEIIFRCESSSGYYGGDLVWISSCDADEDLPIYTPTPFIRLTDDFQAGEE